MASVSRVDLRISPDKAAGFSFRLLNLHNLIGPPLLLRPLSAIRVLCECLQTGTRRCGGCPRIFWCQCQSEGSFQNPRAAVQRGRRKAEHSNPAPLGKHAPSAGRSNPTNPRTRQLAASVHTPRTNPACLYPPYAVFLFIGLFSRQTRAAVHRGWRSVAVQEGQEPGSRGRRDAHMQITPCRSLTFMPRTN